MRLDTLAAALGCAFALVTPASALAADVHVEGSTLVYTGDPVRNQINLNGDRGPQYFQINDNGVATVSGAPCTHDRSALLCEVAGLTAARFELGDGDDELMITDRDEGATTTELPLTIIGGPGNDIFSGGSLDDVLDGGLGNDEIIGRPGNDTLIGGEGADELRAGEGNDSLDGGPGDDYLNGMEGNDALKAGTGNDDVRAGVGDDAIDMRNGEIDKGEVFCEAGIDSVALDPKDEVLETNSGRSWTIEPTCEKATGQSAPKPLAVFLASGRGKPKIAVDLVDAFPTTIKVELLKGSRVVARGRAKRNATRTLVPIKKTAAAHRLRRFTIYRLTARVTVTDTGGRKSVTKKKLTYAFV